MSRFKAVCGRIALALIAAAPVNAQTITLNLTGSGNQAQLTWSPLSGPTRYAIMRRDQVVDASGKVISGTSWAPVTIVTTSAYTDVLPKPSVIYEYRIDASGRLAAATAISSNVVRYAAPAFRTSAQVAIIGAGTQASVSWAPAIDVIGYLVMRREKDPKGAYINTSQRTPSAVTLTTFSDVVQSGIIYEYQVQSVDAAGAMYPSTWVQYSALGQLAAPALTVVGTADKAAVYWSSVYGAASYQITRTQMDPMSMKPLSASAQFTNAGGQLNDVLTEPGAAYEYKVSAVAADGSLGTAARVVYFTPAFTTPTIMSIAGAGGAAGIQWCPSTRVSGYEVWRRTLNTDGTTYGLIQLPVGNTSNYIDTQLLNSTVYEYQVVGVGIDGRRWPSGWVRHAAGTW